MMAERPVVHGRWERRWDGPWAYTIGTMIVGVIFTARGDDGRDYWAADCALDGSYTLWAKDIDAAHTVGQRAEHFLRSMGIDLIHPEDLPDDKGDSVTSLF